ncbi:MAG: MBL fold metallo-hydrolase [Actinobacteria bacterium]|nr:MBL fold metallo-hydrolase [Actinomycetota bacterium]MBU4442100.1 MBL fold metallo-hydrolase [Actinomycetota bacterium]
MTLVIVLIAGCGKGEAPTKKQESIRRRVSGEGEMIVAFVDVGQGDSCIIRLEAGDDDFFAVVDTGKTNAGGEVVEELEDLGCDDIEVLVLTHPDFDHIGGANEVIEKYKVEEVWESGVGKDTKAWETTSAAIDEKKIPRRQVRSGESYQWESASVKVLNPPNGLYSGTGADENNDSVVLLISLGEQDLLLTGDVEVPAQEYMVSQRLSPVEVLKAPHHGGDSAYCQSFIDAVKPQVSVILVGADNTYGHPGETMLRELGAYGQVYRTDTNGNVVVTIDNSGYSVTSER